MASISRSISSSNFRRNFSKHKALYWMALPGMLWYIIFRYVPLGGSIIAFQNYNIFNGIFKSEFIGFAHFLHFFRFPEFWQILNNNLLLGLYDLVIAFPIPIVLALMLNELTGKYFKRFTQTMVYIPHFLSWIIIGGIFIAILSPNDGVVAYFMRLFGLKPIYFMADPRYIRGIIIGAGIWRDAGWGMIVYLAAIAGINPSLYEAAEMDGAGKFRQVLSITLPSIFPIILVMLLLKIGHFLDFGFERVYALMNPMNQQKADIFDTYVYRAGLMQMQYAYATAVGLFKSVIGFGLLLISNTVSKKLTGSGII